MIRQDSQQPLWCYPGFRVRCRCRVRVRVKIKVKVRHAWQQSSPSASPSSYYSYSVSQALFPKPPCSARVKARVGVTTSGRFTVFSGLSDTPFLDIAHSSSKSASHYSTEIVEKSLKEEKR